MQQTIVLVLSMLVVIIAATLWQSIRHKKKVYHYVRQRYGQAPQKSYTDKLESIREYWQACAKVLPDYQAVDQITWNDLELDLVFDHLNTTYSSLGSEVLYARLHRLDGPPPEQLIDVLKHDQALRDDVAYFLHGIAKWDYNHVSDYLFDPAAQKTAGFYTWQGFVPVLGLILLPFHSPLGIITITTGFAWNAWTQSRLRLRIEHGISAIAYLSRAIHFGQKLAKRLKSSEPSYAQALQSALEPLKSIPSKLPIQVDNANPLAFLVQYLNYAILLDFTMYNRALQILIKQPQALHRLWETLGDLEIALAIASLEERQTITRPIFQTDHAITAQNITHPLIKEAVPNPVDFTRSTLVSGSNASGKSTYVKAIAISAITAQCLGRVFADQFSMKPGRIITSMAIRDDIHEGDSYFVAEIKSLRRMIEATLSGQTIYLFIDEILKGTNTIERIAASHAMLSFFHEHRVPLIAATHDIELTELQAPFMNNIHFREEVHQDEITFDYQIKAGPTQTTNAINLLKYYDFPTEVTDQAERLADHFKLNRRWSD
ncbi:MAG TPA: hypothetical protein GXZ74_03270 [Tissierellia bacterium]|nr:hypothetical protein [Tissierellia bacterium]